MTVGIKTDREVILEQELAKAEKLLREIQQGKHSIPGILVQIERYWADKSGELMGR